MIPCIPEHIGEDTCPECGQPHTEFNVLPDRALSIADCIELTKGDNIDSILPIFRIHTKKDYRKAIPAIILITGTTVRILWYNPGTDDGWVIIHEEKDIELPFVLGRDLGYELRHSTYHEETVDEYEVVRNDAELAKLS